MTTTLVFILAEPSSELEEESRTNILASVFDSDAFVVTVMTQTNTDSEWASVKWALNQGLEKSPNSSILLIKNTSVTYADSITIERIVKAINVQTYDVAYLSKWLDQCDKYTSKQAINGTMAVMAKTVAAQGFQAVLISPSGRDKILLVENSSQDFGTWMSGEVASNNIVALCCIDNVFNVDTNTFTSDEDYYKTQLCMIPNQKSKISPVEEVEGEVSEAPSSSINTIYYTYWPFWVVIALILVFILVIVLVSRRTYP
jgi:hypothetical protein